ncbi:cholinesterase 2 [Eurytemora carolleeae]|uniref:cholinesterase 2 n=1 Tax=Eurytemora carolleeae TaxID=1294199 RepID=UPI000C75C54C|nr:cholinesterase 2 [Eurytemora carolleeae]|eukprot:XP_023323658.1 cholinesterase 2-like [Eurytemora affinis]
MFSIRLISACCLVALAAGSESEGILDCLTGPCVTVPGVGKIQGSKKSTQFTGRDVFGFWNIPYGEDTSGENRFQPPLPKPALNDGKDAFDASYLTYITGWWNHVCPQPGLDLGFRNPYFHMWEDEAPINETERAGLAVMGTEDCLKLAVFTPELPSASSNPKLPVIVYIHGGAFMLGGYIGAGPGKLLERDVVLVEMQYRLGPLGFMCLPDDQIAGNMALLDQQLALQWVKDNIAAFGGDADQVTIMGESAGSASVTYHMLSPLSQPLFSKAIAESGSALSSWAFDNEPLKHAKDIASALDCPEDSLSGLITCLRTEKTAAEIVNAHKTYYLAERAEGRLGFGGSSPCAQTHGKIFIDEHPKTAIMKMVLEGSNAQKPALFGSNKNEGSFVLGLMYNSYILPNNVLEDQFFLRHLFIYTLLNAMGLKDQSGNIYEMLEYTFFDHTEMGTWDTMMDGMVNLVGTFFIKASTYEFMKYNVLTGVDSWYYSFEYYGESSLWNYLFPGEQPPIPRGVTHGDELLYLFSTGVFTMSEQDWEISWKMVNLWTNFAIYGDPSAAENPIEGVPTWNRFNDQEMPYLVIDTEFKMENNFIRTWSNPERVGK